MKLVMVGASALLASSASAAVQLDAKGRGDNGDGTTFVIKSKFQSDAMRTEVEFTLKKALPGATHTVCISTDECTYTFTLTANDRGKAFVKFDTNDGTLPPGYDAIVAGDTISVDGVVLATYRRHR
ncbi:MAG: hypothetical protein BroJett003_25430 [Planctomycetota bacterium]|nr:MAG: hypothetical protein BroJett003_25430 [Planctomycetota bacterium]